MKQTSQIRSEFITLYLTIKRRGQMKVYTKTGDKGITSLYGGVKVSKNNIRIDAYGTVDELNSAIGLIRSSQISDSYTEQLIHIQKDLFHVGAELATPKEKMYLANGKSRLPKLVSDSDIEQLEKWIDEMEEELPPLMHFILPGGNLAASHAHLSRCICRRAERIAVALNDLEEIQAEIMKYLNRLSDYLFVLARKIAQDAGHDEINGYPMSRVALFLNGQAPKYFPELKQFEIVFCTDGAYKYLRENGITPDVVSGDFDSLPPEEVPDNIEVVETPDQDFTDFEKALQIIEDRNYRDVYIYGSSGMEHDHFLGNLSTGLKFKNRLNLIFFDDYSYYFFTDKETILEDYKGRIISLYPFPIAKNITTKGLLYGLDNEDLDFSKRTGIRNRVVDDIVSINYSEGELLIFIQRI